MDYLSREEIKQAIQQLKSDTDNVGILLGINRVESAIASLHTADVVSIETVRGWLLHQAKLNENCILNGDFSNSCIELANNINELKRFAKEREDI